MFLRKLWFFLGWLVQLCILLLWVPLMSGWCTTLVTGVADCYFAQRSPWLTPAMPRKASHSSRHSFNIVHESRVSAGC